MAICDLCNQEMTTAGTCSVHELHRDGTSAPVFRYGKDPGWKRVKGRCPDCGVLPDGFHHLGCDVQRCPMCRSQLISCDCGWDELGGADDDDAIVLPLRVPRPAPTRTLTLPPLAAVVAPLRARHHDDICRLAAWSLAHGRPCDRDVAAVCLQAVDEHRRSADRVLLDRPTVQQILWADVWNISQALGARLPEHWHTELWTILGWLEAEDLLDPRSAPLAVLREPLRCYGRLDEVGQPLPAGVEPDVACQCYIPYDPNLPPGIGQHIVGHHPDTFKPFLARARLRARSETPSLRDLEPLHLLARRLRGDRSPFEIHVEEFSFVGVVPAGKTTPDLWLYRHDAPSRRGFDPLVLDATARAWLPQPDQRFRLGYRWVGASDAVAAFRAARPAPPLLLARFGER